MRYAGPGCLLHVLYLDIIFSCTTSAEKQARWWSYPKRATYRVWNSGDRPAYPGLNIGENVNAFEPDCSD